MYNLSSMIAEENQQIGKIIGEDSKSREISLKLYSENKSVEYIAGLVGSSISQVKEWIAQSNGSKSNVLN